MLHEKITISIITATWNCGDTLKDCLDSLAKQTYKNFEHIIVDGASTDLTIEIIKKNISQVSMYISESDEGIYDALNKGIKLSTGDVIGFLHSDDFYSSNKSLSKIAAIFEDTSICAVYGDLIYVKKNNSAKVIRKWRSKQFKKDYLMYGWMPPHPTLYVRRDWYLKTGDFDTSLKISADYLSILKFFMDPEFKTVYLPDTLVTMRLGGVSNKSIKSIFEKTAEDWKVLRSCNFNKFQATFVLIFKNLTKLSQFI